MGRTPANNKKAAATTEGTKPNAVAAKKAAATASRHVAAMDFQDAKQHVTGGEPKKYKEGDDVSHLAEERLKLGLEMGIIKLVEGEAPEADSDADSDNTDDEDLGKDNDADVDDEEA